MANCGAETQAGLRNWANMVFRVKVGYCVKRGVVATPETLDAFALFETQTEIKTRGNHNGKCYKEDYFQKRLRVGREEKDLQNYLSAMLRTLAADFVAKNVPLDAIKLRAKKNRRKPGEPVLLPADTTKETAEDEADKNAPIFVSIDAPHGEENESTIGDTLRDEIDPDTLLALREYRRLAITLAGRIFPMLERPEKVGLAAIFWEKPLSSPQVTTATGVGKSQLSNRLAMKAKPNHRAKPGFRGYLETQVARLEGPTWNELTEAERNILVEFTYECLCYAAVAWAEIGNELPVLLPMSVQKP